MNATTEDTTALILDGEGYQLTISPEAEAKDFKLKFTPEIIERKRKALESASCSIAVTNNEESAHAQRNIRELSALRIWGDGEHKRLKAPFLIGGKLLDAAKKDFQLEIIAEEDRQRKMVGDHAAAVAREKAAKEEEERKAFEAARKAREEALAAQEAAEAAKTSKQGIAAVLAAQEAAKAAEAARQETLANRMDASAEVAGTKVADGIRFAWDFEVTDLDRLYQNRPELVTLTARRMEILTTVKDFAERFGEEAAVNLLNQSGIRAFKKPVVSSR